MPTANYEMNILPISFVDRKRLLGVTQTARVASHGADAISFGNDVD